MLFEIGIIVLACLIPFSFLMGFRWGVRFGKDKDIAAEKPILPKGKPKKNERHRVSDIEAWNIDNYFGPNSKQRDIS